MDEQQRQKILQRYNDGMCAMSDAQMMARAAAQEGGMRNAWPDGIDHARGQAAMTNFWREAVDAMPIVQLPPKPRPTLWQRIKSWCEGQ